MPLECAHIRSTARCVLPVLVGPNTAVTVPAPGPMSRLVMGSNIGLPGGGCNGLDESAGGKPLNHTGVSAKRPVAPRVARDQG